MARTTKRDSKGTATRGAKGRKSEDVEVDFEPSIFGGKEGSVIGFAGRVCKDLEVRYTGKGTAVVNLRLAYDVIDRDDDFAKVGTAFYTATVWGDQAERVGNCINKGDLVTGLGYVQWFEADDEEYDEWRVTVEHIGPSMLWDEVEIIKDEKPAPKSSRGRARAKDDDDDDEEDAPKSRRSSSARGNSTSSRRSSGSGRTAGRTARTRRGSEDD